VALRLLDGDPRIVEAVQRGELGELSRGIASQLATARNKDKDDSYDCRICARAGRSAWPTT
jgi:hypothetical protein